MTINYKDFYTLYTEALKEDDHDKYIAEWYASSIFFSNPEVEADDQKCISILAALENIWNVAHMSFAELKAQVGLTQEKLSQYFCVPKRTIENWDRSRRNAPPYYILMMARMLHVLTVDIEPPERKIKKARF